MTVERISLRLSFSGPVAPVPAARRAVRSLLGDAPIRFVHDALLVTSELVANAAEHTTGTSGLSAWFDPTDCSLRLEVADEAKELPTPAARARLSATPLHGLHVVDAVATAWGSSPTESGHTVWTELRG